MQEQGNSKFVRMTTEPIPKLICTLAVPTIVSMLVTALYTLLFRRKPDPRYENYINAVGMILLLGLIAVVMFNDITKLIVQ